ncbi:MAG: transglycosylase SLT domain-containing protein [candidate division Zixibacteria bacterium]|nr:transglycosylase SLT domain-containing protein [candidate division Zixibacteria bacterium]
MEKTDLRNASFILILTAILLSLAVPTQAEYNNLFAYDDLYRAGRYSYIIDSLAGQSDEVKLIKARAMATLGEKKQALKQLALIDSDNLEAAAIYYRYGQHAKAKNISLACLSKGGFSSLFARYLIAVSISRSDTPNFESLQMMTQSPVELIKSTANLRLAEYYLTDNRNDSTLAYLDRVKPLALSRDDRQKYHYLKSKAMFKDQRFDLALDYVTDGLSGRRFNNHKQVMVDFAVDSLFPNLTYPQSLKLIGSLKRSRCFDEAISLLDKIETNDSLLIIQAWSLFGKRHYTKASRLFESLLESSDSLIMPEAYYGRAVCDYRRGRRLSGARQLLDFAAKYPESPLVPRALFTAGEFYQRSNPQQSAEILRNLTDNYPDSKFYGRSLYLLCQIYQKLGHYNLALQAYSSYGKDDNLADMFDYWLYKTSSPDSALLRRIIERRNHSFYNIKARQQLGINQPEFSQSFDEFIIGFFTKVDKYLASRNYKIVSDERIAYADSLYRYGLENEAGRHLLFLHNQKRSLNLDLALLRKCLELNLDLAFFDILEDFKNLLKRRGFSFSHDEWQRLEYPILFDEMVAFHSGDKIDPYLALAVIRRESRFDPSAVSSVGASGLMQLMPATAAQMAAGDGEPQEWIFEPGYNIKLGCKYLRWLDVRLKRDEVVVAAYNAGPTAAKKWLKQAGPEEETYIETVGYEQSRNYARWVIGDYYWYRYLWPSQFSN